VLAAWCALLTAVVLWPFVEGLVAGFRGQALVLRDMVVPPTMALNDLARGADGPARAVPQDAVLALLSPVIPPPVVVSVLMLAAGFAGALGAAALAGRHGARLPGRFLAATVVLWNPYVAERLLQGHWSVVAAGMLLPLVARLADGLAAGLADGTGPPDSDRGRPRQRGRRTAALILVLAVCALTPTGLVLGVVTACTAAGWRRRVLVPLGAGVLLALPWLLPSLLSATDTLADSRGAELFAARAEPFVGTPGALAGLGGIWNAQAVPASRASGPAALAGVVLALAAVAVVVVLVRRRMLTGPLRRLVVLAAVAVVVPALLATGSGLTLLGGLLETVPGAGLLRDTQKFVVLALPALAVLTGLLPSPVRGRAGELPGHCRASRARPAAEDAAGIAGGSRLPGRRRAGRRRGSGDRHTARRAGGRDGDCPGPHRPRHRPGGRHRRRRCPGGAAGRPGGSHAHLVGRRLAPLRPAVSGAESGGGATSRRGCRPSSP
jgi:hypothetical protein